MATITITFTTIPGITSYTVCYKPVTELSFSCITVSSSPVIITEGIECGVDYDVNVASICSADLFSSTESVEVAVVAEALSCPIPCISYTLSTTSAGGQTSSYIDCEGLDQTVTIGGVSGYDASTICAQENSVVPGGEVTVTFNGPCDEPKTVNVQSVSGYMQPCIGGTIDDYMGAGLTLAESVTVETIFNVEVYWTQRGAGCTFPSTQTFGVTVKAGQTYGDIDPCLSGAYYPSGADICGAAVVGHDNTVDNIVL
jgi:hypothetical protein